MTKKKSDGNEMNVQELESMADALLAQAGEMKPVRTAFRTTFSPLHL